MEKTMTALYVGLKNGELPPKHKIPCFKKDDPFDVENIERIKRAEKWLRDATTKYGL